jgi:hypothetical protein
MAHQVLDKNEPLIRASPTAFANPASSAPFAQGSTTAPSYVNARGQPYRYQGICGFCKRPGHREANCYDRQRASSDAGNVVLGTGPPSGPPPLPPSTDAASPNFSLMMIGCTTLSTALVANSLANQHLWIADSGASCHMTCSNDGMFDCTAVDDHIKIGDGTYIKAVKVGSKNVLVKQPDGTMAKITIMNVKYVPDLWVNLFSLTQPLKQGWKLTNEGLVLKIQKGPHSIVFDQIMDTDSGAITGVIFTPVVNVSLPSVCLPTAVLVPPPNDPNPNPVPNVIRRDINAMHHLFGHANLYSIRRTALYYGIKCVGTMSPCSDCALVKIKQKPVPKTTSSRGNSPGFRLFVDISSMLDMRYGGSRYWVLIVDDFFRYHWSYFLGAKSGLGTVMVMFLQLPVAEDPSSA